MILHFQAAEADYQQVPIEQYGMAMLRGMGFKEEEGIGKNKKSVINVLLFWLFFCNITPHINNCYGS